MKKKYKLTMFLMLVLVLFSACGSTGMVAGEDLQMAAEPVEPQGGETLTVVGADDAAEGGCFQDSLNNYGEEFGVDINYIEAPYGDAVSKVQQMIMSGDTPDLLRLSGGWTEFDDNIVNVSNIIDTNNYLDSLMEEGYYDGVPVAIPLNVTANGIIYNKDLFKEAGIEVPTFEDNWTWEEFSENMYKLVENSSADYAWTMDYSEFRLATIFYTNDGQYYDVDNKQITINSPQNVKMVEEMIQMYNDGLAPKSVWLSGDDPSALFESGTVGLYLAGNWKIQPYSEGLSFDWGVMPLPEGTYGTSSNIGGNFLYPLKDSPSASTASHFIQWFYQDENYSNFLKTCTYLPAKSIDEEIDYGVDDETQEDIDIFREQSEAVNPISIEDNIAKTTYRLSEAAFIREQVTYAVNGDMTAQEAMDTAAENTLEYISKQEEGWTLAYPVE